MSIVGRLFFGGGGAATGVAWHRHSKAFCQLVTACLFRQAFQRPEADVSVSVLSCCVDAYAEFYSVPETTGTALFTYAMAYGISAGLLDRPTYLPVVQRAWHCLSTVSFHPDGTVGNCQPVGYQPLPNFGRESASSFCVGQFAMAATAVAELAADSEGMPWS